MNGQIFISYRRNDSRAYAGRIHDRLVSHFSEQQIFMDVTNIEPGMDFVEAIETAIGKCNVLIAVIGGQWLMAADKNGARSLDNPGDYVRLEIATALKRNIRVIPVLLDDAPMPKSNELPDDLKPLVRRQSLPINHSSFSVDVERLLEVLSNDITKPVPKEVVWVDEQTTREKFLVALSQRLQTINPHGVWLIEDEAVKFGRPGGATDIVWGIISLAIMALSIRDIWVDDAKEIIPYHWLVLFVFGMLGFYKLGALNSFIVLNVKKGEILYGGLMRPVRNLSSIQRKLSADKKRTTWKVVYRDYTGKQEAEEKLFVVENSLNNEVIAFFELVKKYYGLGYSIPLETLPETVTPAH